MQFISVIVTILLYCCYLLPEAAHEAFYQVHEDYEIASCYQEMNVSSLIRCAVYCNISTGCKAATFDDSVKLCQLSNQTVLVQNYQNMSRRTIVLANKDTRKYR